MHVIVQQIQTPPGGFIALYDYVTQEHKKIGLSYACGHKIEYSNFMNNHSSLPLSYRFLKQIIAMNWYNYFVYNPIFLMSGHII